MTSDQWLLPRRALAVARPRSGLDRMVVIQGARQAGKTHLLHLLRQELGGQYLCLDDARTWRAVRTDPEGIVRVADRPLFLDEVQRGGNPLLLAIKSAVDSDDRAGQFVLAGSTRFHFEPWLSESLAGRALFVDLWPLSQGEIDQTAREDIVTVLFDGPARLPTLRVQGETRRAIFERVCRGGLPAAITLSGPNRREFLAAYARSLLAYDLFEVGSPPPWVDTGEFLHVLASRTAQELNLAGVGSTLNVTGHVVRRLVDMFETIYVHHQLPAWSQNLTAKVARKPKMHLVDSGLAALLTGVDAERLTQPGAPFAGALLETFVAGELCRQLTWSDTEARAYHFRGRDGAKVDIVLERPSGEIVGVEVKAAPDFDASDLRGLRLMRDRLGSAFVCGVLIHCGDAVQQVDERIWALPVNALWTEPPA